MRKLFNISALALAAVSMLVVACNPDTPDTPDVKTPSVKLEVNDVRTSEVDFTLTTTDAEEAYYYCVSGTAEATAETIKGEGVKVTKENNTLTGLELDTEYTLYALAINGAKQAIAKETFTTLAEPEKPFEGYELNKMVSAVYRNDNAALAGNYEFTFGNTTELGWDGDIQVFIDFYNVEDSDPLNPVLPNGVYEPNSDFSAFSYDPTSSYVDIVADGEVITSPILGTVTVTRTAATYTVTVEGTLMLLDNMEFSARYTGSIQFVQGGTSAYEFFEEDITIDMDEAQMRYWGSWFFPFCDEVGVEMFDGTFDNNGTLQKGYYLHLSRIFMPKYHDYNEASVPLAEGHYDVVYEALSDMYCLPYFFDAGRIQEYFGDSYFTGTYLQYVENGQVKKIGLVTEGSFDVVHNGADHNISMNFVADNGVKITLTFSGKLNSVNYNDNDETMPERPWTTLDGDHEYNFPAETQGYAFCLGEYMKPGFDNWMLMIYASNAEYPDGYGDMFTTEFLVETGGSRTSPPTGTYNVSLDVADHTMFTGVVSYAGAILFTWYGDVTPDFEGYSTETAPITEGTVTVEDAGNGNYHFVFDLVDDAGYKITGEWTGKVTADDISDQVSGSALAAPKAFALRK